MPRINIEDDIESHDQYYALLYLLGGDRDRALGMLVRFFRIAQKRFAENRVITRSELVEASLEAMIESGWAVTKGKGYEALGAKKQFSWYRQRVMAGKERGKSKRDESGKFLKKSTKETSSGTPAELSGSQRNSIPIQPLTLSLAPSLSQKKENIYISKEQIKECVKTWGETLNAFGVGKPASLDESTIASLIARHGFEKTKLALAGAARENKTADYDPARHVNIRRLLRPDIFEKFVNLGAVESGSKKPYFDPRRPDAEL